MELHGRDLSIQLEGEDVKLLQHELRRLGFAIDPQEVNSSLFGPSTEKAVREIQAKHNLPVTGVVDEDTAKRINEAVDSFETESQRSILQGTLTQPNNPPLAQVIVKAFDKDLRSEELLGEAPTDEEGHYTITYTSKDFARDEKKFADLFIRAYTQDGTLIGTSKPIVFNAGPEETINLVARLPRPKGLSEYERLLATLSPVLQNIALVDLTEDDISFLLKELAGESIINPLRLRLLSQGANLARETQLPTEFFYGIARQLQFRPPLHLETFLKLDITSLKKALTTAVRKRIIPAIPQEEIDDLLTRWNQIRLQQGILIRREVAGLLVNAESGEPIISYRVQGSFEQSNEDPKDLGIDFTDKSGRFSWSMVLRKESEDLGTLKVAVLNVQVETIYTEEFPLDADETKILTVKIPPEVLPKPRKTPIAELPSELGLNLPQNLLSFLRLHKIETLEDIREKGGVEAVGKLPDDVARSGVEFLNAHVNLSVLSSDIKTTNTLISKGFNSIHSIGKQPRAQFVSAMRDELGDFRSAQLHVIADAQVRFLNNVLMGLKAEHANGFPSSIPELTNTPPGIADWFIRRCQCPDCYAAVSPLAYLADLLDYAISHIYQSDLEVTGLKGEYYDNIDLTNRKLIRTDPTVDFDWGGDAPARSIRPDTFSTRWTGQVEPRYSETYIFYAQSDDGVRLWVDGELIIDNWTDHAETEDRGTIDLIAGLRYDIKLEYYENGGLAVARLLWSSPSQPKEVIPQTQLHVKPFIDLQYLAETLHQPFHDLPASCEAAQKEIRQARICIEVLREHLGSRPLTDAEKEDSLARAEIEYLLETYATLLTKLGTSYEEIRLARTTPADDPTLKSIADRLGIAPGYVNRLFLDPAVSSGRNQLTEQALEKIFGLVDTARDRLSDGAKLDDSLGQIKRWNFLTSDGFGVEWHRNTDHEGVIHVKLFRDSSSRHQVELYKDSAMAAADLVTAGGSFLRQATIQLTEENNSGLAGYFTIDYDGGADDIKIVVVPKILGYRLEHLRGIWQKEDWAIDPYMDGPAAPFEEGDLLPVIDPDVMGPDDFRVPLPKADPGDDDGPFDLWIKRRNWVDRQLRTVANLAEELIQDDGAPNLDEIIRQFMKEPIRYPFGSSPAAVTPWADSSELSIPDGFEQLSETLLKGETEEVDAAKEIILSQLKLTLESFSRLIEIRAKDEHARRNRRYEAVTHEEWREAWSIFVQSQKVSVFQVWRREEQEMQARLTSLDGSDSVLFGPRHFWNSLREPEVRDWPPLHQTALPVIDPELWELDSLPKAIRGKPATVKWQMRQTRLSQIYNVLKNARESGDFEAMARLALGEPSPGDPLPTGVVPDALLSDLRSSDPTVVEAARNRIRVDLFMTVDHFVRLMEIKAKAEDPDPVNHPTSGEWNEAYSVLTTAQKMKREYPTWIREETESPLIDPEVLDLKALPELTAGNDAIELFKQRQTDLQQNREDLETARKASGFEEMLSRALGDPAPGDPLHSGLDIDALKDNLASDDQRVVNESKLTINKDLFMPLEDFDHLMEVKARNQAGHVESLPTDEDWREVYAILAHARKLKHEHPVWAGEETGMVYWKRLKATLSKHRSSAETRYAWQQALGQRSKVPIIDPDVITGYHFRQTLAPELAYTVFSSRSGWVNTKIAELNATSAAETALDENIANALFYDEVVVRGLDGAVLVEIFWLLEKEREKGNGIRNRLEQLNLSNAAYAYLLRIRKLLEDGADVLESEWEQVNNILVQVYKSRLFGEWNKREQQQHITLSPDDFKIPEPPPLTFPFPEPEPLPPWRGTWRGRRNWEDKLKARIEQQQTLVEALRQAVSVTEEETLPLLRDALIKATGDPTIDFGVKAKSITDELLIDAQAGGCQMTTRIGQAIEAIHGLLWGLRTGQLQYTYPNLELDAPDLDEEWKWIGSYATWRAAMFVFMYPENILLPSLRKPEHQTPAFRKLVSDFRNNRRLTAETADEAAREYSDYFRDVSNLTLEAAVKAWPSSRLRTHIYLIARGEKTGMIYLSSYDPADGTPYSQTLWKPVPNLEQADIADVAGATAYISSSVEEYKAFIYIFLRTRVEGQDKLEFIKYDLVSKSWEQAWSDLKELEPPGEAANFSAFVVEPGSQPARLVIQLSDRTIYARRLNQDGSDWEDGEWDAFLLVGRHLGWQIQVQAIVHQPPGSFCLIAKRRSDLVYRVFDSRLDDGQWRTLLDSSDWSSGYPAKAFRWPSTNRNYVFWQRGSRFDPVSYFSFDISTAHRREPKRTLEEFERWLDTVTNLWLRHEMGRYTVESTDLRSAFRAAITGSREEKGLVRGNIEPFVEDLIDSSEDWRWADQEIRNLTSSSSNGLVEALTKLLDGTSVGVTVRGDDDIDTDIHTYSMDPQQIVHASGTNQIAYNSLGSNEGLFRAEFRRAADRSLAREVPATRIAPRVSGPFDISERLSDAEKQIRRAEIESVFLENAGAPAPLQIYLEEAYYFVPIHIALQLQRQGNYPKALDWFRTVYDYSQSGAFRSIYPRLEERTATATYERFENWLLDPLNPHFIAETRNKTYLRFTLLAIIRCFLDYADAEFTRDTAESLPRARTLYRTALELLDLDALQQHLRDCEDLIGTLAIEIGEQITATAPEFLMPARDIIGELTRVTDYSDLQDLIQRAGDILASGGHIGEKIREIGERARRLAQPKPPPKFNQVITERPQKLAGAQTASLSQPNIFEASSNVAGAAGADFKYAVANVSGLSMEELETIDVELPWLGTKIFGEDGVNSPGASMEGNRRFHTYQPTPSFRFCVPPNPVLQALRLHAELNLFKIRTCRNISGMARQLEPYAAPTDTLSGLPQIGAGGQLLLPGTVTFQATPYRFQILIERAKQLAQMANQFETAMLSAIEKRDVESFNLLKARQEVQISRQGMRLQDLRMKEAQEGVSLAELQRDRTQIQFDYYQGLLDEGFLDLEEIAIGFMIGAGALHLGAAASSFLAAADVTSLQGSGWSNFASGLSSLAAMASTTASILQVYANQQRREEEWKHLRSLAQHDSRIGRQQIKIVEDQVRVVGQERHIAKIQTDYAQETADYLATKFTSVELYDWMSNVLEGVYSFFLQQATALARLAEGQLAFERQEVPSALIQSDYWKAPSDELSLGDGTGGGGPDRRGLTGSARLLQDIVRLDQYAFETDQRKLQLTKTISLARMAPAEFQRFRENGVINFYTHLEMFDRDFPGNYIRLIKRVRTSVIALIPPAQGIKATLSCTGLSRVVIGSAGLFQKTIVRRNPESVVLTSPRDAAGLFELTPQSQEMLLPFEGMGVDTSWEFRMPKASNQFDFSTIADVLITIEYTALNSFDYKHQVIRELDRSFSADRPFSFRHQFADQWYDLHNPDRTDKPMVVQFQTRREDFPPNLGELSIKQVGLFFSRKDGLSIEIPVTHFTFSEDGALVSVGGEASTVDGIISTLRGNAGSWTAMLGKKPIGKWELALASRLSDGRMISELFENEEIEDILFVITYEGVTPVWPS